VLDRLGEVVLGPDGAVSAVGEAITSRIGLRAGMCVADVAPEIGAFVAEPPRRAVRAASVRLAGADVVISRERGSDRAQVGVRREDVSPLEAAVTGAFRALGEAAHDLGGPITGIVGAIDAMLEDGPVPEGKELLAEARSEALRLVELVRRRREGVDPRAAGAAGIEVVSLVRSVFAALDVERARADVELRLAGPPAVAMRVDGGIVRACTTALVLNAIEASRRRAKAIDVRIAVASAPRRSLRIEVEDAGRGIAADEVPLAGELFRSSRRTGSGTGLAAVRHAMAIAGGALAIDSEQGLGTIATLAIPERGAIGDPTPG
jgi:signal transduction histidine kinase